MPVPKRALEPGSFIQAQCTRCKAELRHTVVALVEGVPVRVKCNTCGGEHAYRAQRAPSSRSVPREREPARAPTKKPPTGLHAEWNRQLEAAAARPVLSYRANEKFVAGDVVDHASFGRGVVQRVVEPGKILVLFSGGTKVLVCGGDR